MAPGQVILLLLRLGIGGIFLYAGALKIWDPLQFALDVEHYELTSRSVSTLVAIYLPWLEAITGLALLTRRLPLGALLLLAGMTLVFIAAIVSAWARGLDISCGCFGREADAIKTNFPLIIGRDLALLAGIGLLLVAEWRAALSARLAGRSR
jgi:uncharacterized membrane protein YphA (DoxX/SURF4 family)